MLVDRRARRFLGMDRGFTRSEINGTKVDIVGNFALGPDFVSDGTVIMSERTFAQSAEGLRGTRREPRLGVVKLSAGANPADSAAGVAKGAAGHHRGHDKKPADRFRARLPS